MHQPEIGRVMGIDYSAVSVMMKRLSEMQEKDRHLAAEIGRVKRRPDIFSHHRIIPITANTGTILELLKLILLSPIWSPVPSRSPLFCLLTQNLFVGSNTRNYDIRFAPHICGSIIHGDTECPLVRTLQFFISQTRIGRIRSESFNLLPKLYSDLFREIIQLLDHRIRENDFSRQSVSWPLSPI